MITSKRGPTLAAFALTFLAGTSALAQSSTETAQRIIDYELANSRAWETLAHLSDRIGPRLSGSKGADLAVKWTTKRFAEWGIEVRNERVMVPHWVRGAERARLVSHNNQPLAITALGGSVATPAAGITAEVVEVTSFEQLETLGRAGVAGKIVLYYSTMDMALVESGRAFEAYGKAVTFRGTGASRAAALGAVASVVRSVASASLRTPHTGAMRYEEGKPKIPAGALSTEDADLVHRLLGSGEKVRMHLLLTPRTLPDVASANVVAEIRGSERPDEIVLVGGHLDSWDLGTGAIDNGSGCAMVMETMRVLKELGIRPKRTIRAVLFMNEENGLRGGKAYFANAARREELHRHVAAVETDAGSAAPFAIITTLEEKSIGALRPRLAPLEPFVPMGYQTSKHTGADTSPLTDAGVVGFGLVPDPRHYFDYHHTAADTLDKVDPKHLTQNAATVAALVYLLSEEL